MIIVISDHGKDPIYTGSDHIREVLPFLTYSPSMKGYRILEDS